VAYQSNPSYLSSLKKIELAKLDAAKFGVEMLPEISGQYTSTYVYNSGGSAKGNPIDGVYPSQRTDLMLLVAKWELHPTTSVPGGLSGLAKIRQMDYLSRDIKTRIQQGVKASYTALGAAEKRKEALRESVLANQRVVESFEVQYQEGGRPLFDLLDAYEQLYNAQLNLMRVIMANARASYQVRKQMGELIPSVIQTGGIE
jgi:Outer membrane efflux protein